MIELVVFDIAGTTIKDEYFVQKILVDTASEYCQNISKESLDHVMGWPKPKALKYLIETNSDRKVSDVFANQLNQVFINGMIGFFKEGNNLQEIDGTTNIFKELKTKGIKVALDTGFSRAIANVIIEKLGWRKLLDASVASDEVTHGRPAADMIFHLMAETGVKDVSAVVKVGDTKADMKQGRNAKCGLVIGVTSGSCTRDELISFEADFVIPSVKELPQILFNN